MALNTDAAVYVAGHRGLVGSALIRQLQAKGYTNIITRTHAELDLTDQAAVRDFFAAEKPGYVLLAAAKVGGIHANNTYPAEFIQQNLVIQANVIHEAWRSKVKRLLFLGSSCIYPKDCPQPMKEEYLLTGPLEPTNRPYALAKIAGIEMCWAYISWPSIIFGQISMMRSIALTTSSASLTARHPSRLQVAFAPRVR